MEQTINDQRYSLKLGYIQIGDIIIKINFNRINSLNGVCLLMAIINSNRKMNHDFDTVENKTLVLWFLKSIFYRRIRTNTQYPGNFRSVRWWLRKVDLRATVVEDKVDNVSLFLLSKHQKISK